MSGKVQTVYLKIFEALPKIHRMSPGKERNLIINEHICDLKTIERYIDYKVFYSLLCELEEMKGVI